MFGISWDEFWWTNITGPSVVVSKVTMGLLENSNVILKVPSDLPWRHSMRGAIQSEFRDRSISRDIIIESIDAVDDNPDKMEPGKFILQRFADDATKRGFRDKSKISIQDYISQREILKNRIVWVKGLTGNAAEQWLKFCKGFSPKIPNEGLFVFEIHGDFYYQETKRMRLVDYCQYISSYDVQLLNSFILDNQNQWSNAWKKYISSVAAVVCDTDAEISELLLRTVSFTENTPFEGIALIAESPEFCRRGNDSLSEHILKLFRNGDYAEIKRRIWSAQVQTLFPIIELERIEIVNRYCVPIRVALEHENTYQYGKVITDPIEVEFGTLCYLMARRDDENLYLLYIPDESCRERIHFLHEYRNNLAHAECCTPEQVVNLLKNY